MTLFEHMDGIEEMVQKTRDEQNNYMMLAAGGVDGSNVFAKDFVGGAGAIRSDMFGNLTSGNSIFSVGSVMANGIGGALRCDTTGNVFQGNSSISIGRVQNHGMSGDLKSDMFGNVSIGDSNYSIGSL